MPLSHELLLLYKNDPEKLSEALAVNHLLRINDPAVLGDIAEALEFWLENTRKFPDQFRWYTNWEIILKEEAIAIGGIGFSADPKVNNGISMVGYGLDVRFYGRGHASEALQGILSWAFSEGLEIAIADTPVNHIASQRVLLKNGFSETGRDDLLIHWQRPKDK